MVRPSPNRSVEKLDSIAPNSIRSRSLEPRQLVTCRVFSAGPRSQLGRLRIKAKFALLRSCTYKHDRKNWLFVGSELAGERAAMIMSLLQSAKLNAADPCSYLKDVLTRLPTQLNSRIEELLPHRWKLSS